MMRTRCPYCQATFRVKPEQLKVRQGQVRCGKCRRVFDGIRGLIEDGSASPATTATTELAPSAPIAPTPAPPPVASFSPAPVPVAPPAQTIAAPEPIVTFVPAPEPAPPEPTPEPPVVPEAPPPTAPAQAEPVVIGEFNSAPTEVIDVGTVDIVMAAPVPEPVFVAPTEPEPLPEPESFQPAEITPPEPFQESIVVEPAVHPQESPAPEVPVTFSEFVPISETPVAPEPPPAEDTPSTELPPEVPAPYEDEPIEFFEVMEPPDAAPQAPAQPMAEERFESPQEIIESITLQGVEPLDEEPTPPAEEHKPTLPKSKPVSISRPLAKKPVEEEEDPSHELSPPTIMDFQEDEPQATRRWPWVLGSIVAFLVLLAQLAIHYRTEVIASAPATRAAYSAVCPVLGCRIELPQEIDLIGIDNSELSPDEKHSGSLHLVALLRNRSAHVQAWPHLELTLTDAQERPVIRRVLSPAEYLPATENPTTGFPRRGEQPVRLTLTLNDVPAVGYRLYVFYP